MFETKKISNVQLTSIFQFSENVCPTLEKNVCQMAGLYLYVEMAYQSTPFYSGQFYNWT